MSANGFAYWIVARNLDGNVAWLVGPIFDPHDAQVLYGAVRDEAWMYVQNEECITWEYGVARVKAEDAGHFNSGQLNGFFLPSPSIPN